MAILVAPVAGTVLALLVDEGTLIAEEDELAVLDGPDGSTAVVTPDPGVLREWFVEPGDVVAAGVRLALIDET